MEEIKCPDYLYFNEEDSLCYESCPSVNYFEEFDYKVCEKCDPNCENGCFGPLEDQCKNKSMSFYKQSD